MIRVITSFNSFIESENKINEDGFACMEKLIKLAAKNEVLVLPTGPSLWEGFPKYSGEDHNYIISDTLIKAQENFWMELGTRYEEDERIFAFDILNEPKVYEDGRFWQRWESIVKKRGGGSGWPRVIYTGRPPGMCDEAVLELEKLYNEFGNCWLDKMVGAVRQVNKSVL
ncbi:glycoside hydrolase family 5 protein, partial [Patescibacteria group bacterium]|nr:glycoside hydrolase family 5 protein [Patescibacteria group bacterium]